MNLRILLSYNLSYHSFLTVNLYISSRLRIFNMSLHLSVCTYCPLPVVFLLLYACIQKCAACQSDTNLLCQMLALIGVCAIIMLYRNFTTSSLCYRIIMELPAYLSAVLFSATFCRWWHRIILTCLPPLPHITDRLLLSQHSPPILPPAAAADKLSVTSSCITWYFQGRISHSFVDWRYVHRLGVFAVGSELFRRHGLQHSPVDCCRSSAACVSPVKQSNNTGACDEYVLFFAHYILPLNHLNIFIHTHSYIGM